MRLAIVCRGTSTTASSRVRALQYVPFLARHDVEVRTVAWRTSGRTALAGRMLAVARAARWADVVMLQKPIQSPTFLAFLARVNPHILVDFDDAVWASTDGVEDSNVRFENRLMAALEHGRVVTPGSEYLADWVRTRRPATDLVVIPSSIDLDHYTLGPTPHDDVVVAGWVGSAPNYADFSPAVLAALRELTTEGSLRVRFISSVPFDADFRTEFARWSETSEVDELRSIDIGLMPLRDTERSRGRCGFKAVQCMALGKPVVASPVGSAAEVVESGVTGFLAETTDEWLASLRKLAENADLRRELGGQARSRVEQRFSVQANGPRLLQALERAAR